MLLRGEREAWAADCLWSYNLSLSFASGSSPLRGSARRYHGRDLHSELYVGDRDSGYFILYFRCSVCVKKMVAKHRLKVILGNAV